MNEGPEKNDAPPTDAAESGASELVDAPASVEAEVAVSAAEDASPAVEPADGVDAASEPLPAEDSAASDGDLPADAPGAEAPAAEAIEADADEDDDLDGEPEPEPEVAPAGPIELNVEEEEEIKKDWYILKVQSNRERSIAAALQRKVAIEGLEHLFGEILVPTEKVTEFKGGKKKIVERKLWPGYIAVEMHVNDDTWFAIRETGGIGDFTGSGGAPTPMAPHEVAKILHTEEEETDDAPKLDIKFAIGDKVKVNDGNFESFEGEVATIDEASGKISVMISIFGRSTPVELEYWQVEAL
ncbi:MAG: transcription termination/antitermination protein NusG [Planctomycetota bacterium]